MSSRQISLGPSIPIHLGPDCLTVVRTCLAVAPEYRKPLADAVSAIADTLRLLSSDPSSAEVRSRAVNLLTSVGNRLNEAFAGIDAEQAGDALRVATAAVDLLVVDTLIFCGVAPGPPAH